MTEHKHRFAKVDAGYTAPGEKTLSWKQCQICGEHDPDHPRPEEAYDSDPDLEDE